MLLALLSLFFLSLGVRMAKSLALDPDLDHEVPGSNPAGGGIQLMTAQSLSLSPFHRLSMT